MRAGRPRAAPARAAAAGPARARRTGAAPRPGPAAPGAAEVGQRRPAGDSTVAREFYAVDVHSTELRERDAHSRPSPAGAELESPTAVHPPAQCSQLWRLERALRPAPHPAVPPHDGRARAAAR